MKWRLVHYPKFVWSPRQPNRPAPQLVRDLPLGMDAELQAAVDRLIEEEADLCPQCRKDAAVGQIADYCRQCGVVRDQAWWERILRLAQGMLTGVKIP